MKRTEVDIIVVSEGAYTGIYSQRHLDTKEFRFAAGRSDRLFYDAARDGFWVGVLKDAVFLPVEDNLPTVVNLDKWQILLALVVCEVAERVQFDYIDRR